MRIRTALKAKRGSLWTKGQGDIVPYGLWKLADGRQADFIILVEGESDCWSLWYHGFPALGIPGADLAKTIKPEYLKNISRIFVMREPDQGGVTFIEGVAKRLQEIGWSGKAFELKLDGIKDPNELHKQNPSCFKEIFQKALDSAGPLPEPPESVKNPDDGKFL
jgi:putative DNA primase/helicase